MRKPMMLAMLVLLLLGTAACRSASTATPDEVDQEVIEASIRTQIATEYPDETFDLGVDVTRDGVVTLTGDVDSAIQRTRIEELARGVAGVQRVINRLTVG